MTYTLGCSFTKWFWHTWSDWLQIYTNNVVVNMGWPGLSNESIYWQIINISSTLTAQDTVIIMLTGNNRVSMWYDHEWIEQKNCRGFFPNDAKLLEFGTDASRGFYRLHPEYDTSLTHMIVDNFNLIFNIQNLLDKIGCHYQLIFWQNPWYDVRPKTQPVWKSIWNNKQKLSRHELNTAESILKLKPIKKLLHLINWKKFYLAPVDPTDPNGYTGMWEYKNQKQTTKEYLEFVHEDPHPDAVIQHDFVTEVILNTPGIHRDYAKQVALESLKYKINLPISMLIPEDLTQKLPKLYEK